MRSSINLTQNDSNLSGTIGSVYSPAIQMMPGGTAQSDPMWILLPTSDSDTIQSTHAYSEGFVLRHNGQNNDPNGWMTVATGTSPEDLLLAAAEWKVRSIRHALVPGGWQTGKTPGNMGMGELAKGLRQTGMKPGLTVDPLRSSRSIRDVTLQAQDGSHWLDISTREAREYGAKSLRQLVSWKYEFFVVEITEMPNDILRSLNITRSVADRVSFELMCSAADGRPVIPSADLTIGNDAEAWQVASSATAANNQNNILTGPVRLDVRGVEELSESADEAISRFPGPVEVIGTPGRRLRRQITESIPASAER
jgi:hypothetical protein